MGIIYFIPVTYFILLSLTLAAAAAGDYSPTSSSAAESPKPKPETYSGNSNSKPNDYNPAVPDYGSVVPIPKPEEDAFPVAIEGTVICRSGSNYVPVQGAVVRITCWGVDEEGYEINTLSCQTGPTDAKGYFFKTLRLSDDNIINKLRGNCKAFLEQSPLEECKIPIDVNKGITGFPLSSYHILHDKGLKLYSVGPFFYTPEPKASSAAMTPSGY